MAEVISDPVPEATLEETPEATTEVIPEDPEVLPQSPPDHAPANGLYASEGITYTNADKIAGIAKVPGPL